jgi:hypothetical protein
MKNKLLDYSLVPRILALTIDLDGRLVGFALIHYFD